MYRPPNYDLQQTRDLIECLNVLCDIDHVVTICGDFNFREIDWAQIIDISTLLLCASEFASFVVNNGFTQLIKQPTRKNKILDLLMVNDAEAIYDVTVLQPFSTSDHCALSWRTWFPQVAQVVGDSGYDFKRANYAILSNYFQNIDWLQLFTRVPQNDVEGIWQIFKSIVIQAIVLHVPRRVIHAKVANRYPSYIQRAIRLKRTLWRNRYYAGGRVRYTIQARKCKRLIKRYYANKERHLLSGKSPTAFYKHVNAKLYSSHSVAPLRVNGQVLTKDEDKVQAFNTYFCSVFTAPSSIVISLPTNNTQ